MPEKSDLPDDWITPEALGGNLSELFKAYKPEWFIDLGLEDAPLELFPCCFTIEGHEDKLIITDAVMFALLIELTRFGGGVVIDGNYDPNSNTLFVRVTFNKDPVTKITRNIIVGRLVLGIGSGKIAKAVDGYRRALDHLAMRFDLRFDNLYDQGGSARLEAVEASISYATDLARGCRPEGCDITKYVTNLRALYNLHDEKIKGREPY